MPCFSPLSAWQTESGGIVFAERGNIRRELQLPCGQCIGCRVDKAQAWAIRCTHEAQLHSSSCFATLTYSEEHYPQNGSLDYRHFQAFIRALRQRERRSGNTGKIRFFMCGEYGEKLSRPHYHALLFGYWPTDCVRLKQNKGHWLYRSDTLDALWGRGFVNFGAITEASAGYCAQYATKKITGPRAEDHYSRVNPSTGEIVQLTPEFARMSLKPGIGSTWLEKYRSDVYNYDQVIINGKSRRPPKFYDKKQALHDPDQMEYLVHKRTSKALDNFANNSRERLAVREQVLKAKLNQKERQL